MTSERIYSGRLRRSRIPEALYTTVHRNAFEFSSFSALLHSGIVNGDIASPVELAS